ncbi:hypothetical protein CMTB2_05787 [Caminibacter mediatlanticus TB-2]|uniref:Uncharacterized protein n=1 Tax=Caminibacter mediatlanticus TB-2 TaxID=391592 RepID=A0AAI9F1U6_9BACT|nr:hypothetical protein CMTB2_05787 [Caminibacter mediatlanticus TB-2]
MNKCKSLMISIMQRDFNKYFKKEK